MVCAQEALRGERATVDEASGKIGVKLCGMVGYGDTTVPNDHQTAHKRLVRVNGWPSLLDSLIGLILVYGPWVIFGVVALESAGVPLPGETILVGAALLASSTDQISIITVVVAAAGGAIVGDSTGYAVGRRFGLPMLEKYGHYIHLDKGRLLIGC